MANIKYPKGYKSGTNQTKLAISFPDLLFESIMVMAKNEKKTFNAMVVELCSVGLLDLLESDKHEPAPIGEMHDA